MHNTPSCHDWVNPGRAVAACSHVCGSAISDLIALGSTCTCPIFGAASCSAVVSAGQRPPTKYQNSLRSQTSVLICILLSMPGTCWADMFIRGSNDPTYSYRRHSLRNAEQFLNNRRGYLRSSCADGWLLVSHPGGAYLMSNILHI